MMTFQNSYEKTKILGPVPGKSWQRNPNQIWHTPPAPSRHVFVLLFAWTLFSIDFWPISYGSWRLFGYVLRSIAGAEMSKAKMYNCVKKPWMVLVL
jgi:hypothetical protein